MKISKEVKTGVITLAAIGLLITGVNFLKGNSFFGGDKMYHAFFAESGQLSPGSSVTVNGVTVGKVVAVDYIPTGTPKAKVKVSFNLQNDLVRIPVGSIIEIASLDLFNKGMVIVPAADISKGYYKPGDAIPGKVAEDMISQVKSYADPISRKVEAMMGSIDKMVVSLSSFWDTTATSEIEGSMHEVKIAIKRFGNVAKEVENLVHDEKLKFAHIMSNVENISNNIKLSNQKITDIIGNTKKISDDLVSADFKNTILEAKNTLSKLNGVLEGASNGTGTLGKLLSDEKLYTELVNTNLELQNLVSDLQLHPERYVHFSVLGSKTKGVPLSGKEEKKLRKLLDSIPN